LFPRFEIKEGYTPILDPKRNTLSFVANSSAIRATGKTKQPANTRSPCFLAALSAFSAECQRERERKWIFHKKRRLANLPSVGQTLVAARSGEAEQQQCHHGKNGDDAEAGRQQHSRFYGDEGRPFICCSYIY